jgi:hypothetical protein
MSSGGRRSHPLARSTAEEPCCGLRDVARRNFLHNRNVNRTAGTGAQRELGSGCNWATYQDRARLSSLVECWRLVKKSGGLVLPPLHT